MSERQPVVRNCETPRKQQLHANLMLGWNRAIARHGKGAFADALDSSTVAVNKQLAGSMPEFHTIMDVMTFAPDVLQDVMKEHFGKRIVDAEAVCDVDDLNLLIGRVLVMINEATHPDGPGGRSIVHSEYLKGEDLMRQLHAASGEWLEQCAAIRRPREVRA